MARSLWRPVTRCVSQGSTLGPALYSIFINDFNDGIERTLSKFVGDAKLGRVADMPKGCAAIQRFSLNIRKLFLLWGWLSTSAGCPENLWKYSKASRTWSWETGLSRGAGPDDLRWSLLIAAISVILWNYCTAWQSVQPSVFWNRMFSAFHADLYRWLVENLGENLKAFSPPTPDVAVQVNG